MKIMPPCKDCLERYPACHDKCEKYKAFKDKSNEQSTNRYKAMQIENAIKDNKIKSCQKLKKRGFM